MCVFCSQAFTLLIAKSQDLNFLPAKMSRKPSITTTSGGNSTEQFLFGEGEIGSTDFLAQMGSNSPGLFRVIVVVVVVSQKSE